MVQGTTPDVSLTLVRHRSTRAVGFTGSLQAGRALFDAAATRPAPIPVFSEMGSINPVFVFPGALKERGAELAQSLAKSVTVGVGQFCTKPGLVVGLGGANLDEFGQKLGAGVSSTPAGTMLHAGIAARYASGLGETLHTAALQLVAATPPASPEKSSLEKSKTLAQAAVFATKAQSFLENPELHEELFPRHAAGFERTRRGHRNPSRESRAAGLWRCSYRCGGRTRDAPRRTLSCDDGLTFYIRWYGGHPALRAASLLPGLSP